MAARDRWKEGRDKRERGRFLALPYAVLTSAAYLSLSPHGIKLLIDLGAQYNGSNNGDLSAAWKLMRPRGWRSEETLAKAKKELLRTQLIVETRKGWRPNRASLYAITFFALDHCDASASASAAPALSTPSRSLRSTIATGSSTSPREAFPMALGS